MKSNNEFTVIRLNTQDVRLFQELIFVFADVFEHQDFKIPSEDYLQKLLHKPDFIVFAALADNKVVGGLTAYILTSYSVQSEDVYVLDLAVKTAFQRKGIGKKLMETVIEHCIKQNMNVLFVQADEEDQHAVDFYNAVGGIALKAVNFDFPLSHPKAG